jgi:hypothetical protein
MINGLRSPFGDDVIDDNGFDNRFFSRLGVGVCVGLSRNILS